MSDALLVALCRRGAPADLDPVPGNRTGGSISGHEFLELAASHGVLGLSLSVLARSARWRDAADLGEREVADRLRSLRRRSALFDMKRDRIVDLLSNIGVRPVILKGAALSLTTYDQPSERDLADLDILIREDCLEQSLETLRAQGYVGPSTPEEFAGYRRFHFHIHLRHPDADIVEIHWALTKASSPFQLDANEVLAQAVSLERPGQPALMVPRQEHMLLHLVIQNLQEGFSRLARLVDTDRIVVSTPDLDWDALVATARRGNLASATAVSLRLASRLLETPIPDRVLRELRPGLVARCHLAIMRPVQSLLGQRLQRSHVGKLLHELWLLSGIRKRTLRLRQILTAEAAVTFPQEERAGTFGCLWRLGKVFVLQVYLYVAAVVTQTTPSGRARMRFW